MKQFTKQEIAEIIREAERDSNWKVSELIPIESERSGACGATNQRRVWKLCVNRSTRQQYLLLDSRGCCRVRQNRIHYFWRWICAGVVRWSMNKMHLLWCREKRGDMTKIGQEE